MIKKLIFFGILFSPSILHAESRATVYGSIDAGVRHLTDTNARGDSRLTMNSVGTFSSNRLGVKGNEDLGGGWRAHYVIEMGFNSGTGSVDLGATNIEGRLFNRATVVGITGPIGAVNLGHQYSIAFKTISFYEPFDYKYIGIIPLADAAAGTPRPNSALNPFNSMGGGKLTNDLQYIGKFGGLMVGAEYAFGETTGDTSDGATQAIGAAYTSGPISIGGAYTRQKPDVAPGAAVAHADQRQWTLGGSYRIGKLKLAGGYLSTDTNTQTPNIALEAKNAWVGASYTVLPAFTLTTGFYRTRLDYAGDLAGDRELIIVGAAFSLSKRTTIYADIDTVSLSGVVSQFLAGGQTRQTGASIGIHHLF